MAKSAAAIRKRGREMMAAAVKANPPAWDATNPEQSLARCLNYYRLQDDKKKVQWAIAWWKSKKKNVNGFTRIPVYEFSTVGGICHLASIGVKLHKRPLDYMDNMYDKFRAMVKKMKPEVVKAEKKVVSIQDRMDAQYRLHMAEFDGAIDEFIKTGKSAFDGREYLISKLVKAPIAKRIADEIKRIRAEFIQASNKRKGDEDLAEGYKLFQGKKMRKVVKFLEDLMNSTLTAAVTLKKVRKPRARKEKPASVVAGKVKYLAKWENITGLDPSTIIGKEVAFTFNIKYRRFMQYKAVKGETLTFKGTTLQNWDPAQSYAKCIRKPAEWFKSINGAAQGQITKLLEQVAGKKCELAGRFNDDTLVVKVY